MSIHTFKVGDMVQALRESPLPGRNAEWRDAVIVRVPTTHLASYEIEYETDGHRESCTYFNLRRSPRKTSDTAPESPVVARTKSRELSAREALCEKLLRTLVKEFDKETPERMARALGDLVDGYEVTDFAQLLKTFPVEGDVGVVAVSGIPFASVCEHHVLPFSGTVSVAYLPKDRIVGLSKIPRLVRAVSRRLQVQERIGAQVADAIMKHVGALGAMVIVRGRHTCMQLRGAESPGEMVTSAARGVFLEETAARAEAMGLMR